MNPLIFLVVAAGLSVASLACVLGAYRHGEKKGRDAENWRLRRLYVTRRDAAEYELVTGLPLDRVHPPHTRRRSAWAEAATGGARP